MTKQLHARLLIAFLTVGLIGFAFGWVCGVREGGNYVLSNMEEK